MSIDRLYFQTWVTMTVAWSMHNFSLCVGMCGNPSEFNIKARREANNLTCMLWQQFLYTTSALRYPESSGFYCSQGSTSHNRIRSIMFHIMWCGFSLCCGLLHFIAHVIKNALASTPVAPPSQSSALFVGTGNVHWGTRGFVVVVVVVLFFLPFRSMETFLWRGYCFLVPPFARQQ